MKFILSEPVYNSSCIFLINEPLSAVEVLARKNVTKDDYEGADWESYNKNDATYFSFVGEKGKDFRILHIPKGT